MTHICLIPRLSGVGGMVSFQQKLAAGLAARQIQTGYDPRQPGIDAALVIGGTRHLGELLRLKNRGVRIVQRLDGMNWLHRLRRTGLRHWLRAEAGNWLLALIRQRLADRVVYQSEFSRRWWERVHGPPPVPDTVVYNGVDLSIYSNEGPHDRPQDRLRLLLVEGSLMGGYELGLETATRLAAGLHECRSGKVELVVAGRVAPEVRQRWEGGSPVPIHWAGLVPSERIPALDRSAHLLYSADLNAACPNSVIEALACGLPVLAFDTGALPELVDAGSGRVVPYGGDPWRLDPPDLPRLVTAAEKILDDQASFRLCARQRAEALFGLDVMVAGYVKASLG